MKKPTLPRIALITVVLTVLWCAWWLRDLRPIVVTGNDMDINSGDVRHCVFLRCPWIGDVPVKSAVHDSRLSQEARRLGIDIPSTRAWRLMDRHYEGVFEDRVYGLFVFGVSKRLLAILDETNTPNEERRVILERFLTSMRTQEWHRAADRGYVMIADIADKHGLHVFAPEFEEQVKQMRREQQGQVPGP